MRLYRFIKITNNDNPSEFCIECTAMTNGRARISCLRSHYFTWEDNGGTGKWRNVWDLFFKDYSFYVVEKKEFSNLHEARLYRQVVHERYMKQLNRAL